MISLELVDPRFYHLDTALTVLDDTTIAYYPPAFRMCRERIWRRCSPTRSWWTAPTPTRSASMPSPMGATWCIPAAAVGFAEQLADAGFEPIGVDMSELLKGGGSVKCCTLEVYS